MKYLNQKQSNSAFQVRQMLRMHSFDNIRESEFMGCIFIEGEKYSGNISIEIGKRGSKKILCVPTGMSKKQFI